MRTANFPERVNQRRISALDRASVREERLSNTPPLSAEVASLQAAIVLSARDVCTKKNRSSRGKRKAA